MAADTLGEWKAGWRNVLAAGMGMAAGISMFATAFGFFIVPLQDAFGWSRSQLAVLSYAIIASSLAMPVVGALLDRWGSSVFTAVGAVAFAAVYAGMALNPGELWLFYGLLVLVGLVAGPCTMPTVFARPIVGRFTRSRGLALGIGLSGSYGMIVVLSPVLQSVIANQGWRLGFGLLAGLSLVFGLGAAALLRGPRPAAPATAPRPAASRGEGLAAAMRDPRFWLLVIALIAASLPVGGVISQLQPMLSDKGVSLANAAMLGSLYAAAILVGRMGVGALLDRFWPPLVGAVSLAAPAIGLLLFAGWSENLTVLMIALALIGIGHGAEGDLANFFTARYFGVRAFGSIMGVFALLIGVSIALGGVVFAGAFDGFGSYTAILLAGAGAMALAAVLLLVSGLGKWPPRAEVVGGNAQASNG